jgi:hypothetical protein
MKFFLAWCRTLLFMLPLGMIALPANAAIRTIETFIPVSTPFSVSGSIRYTSVALRPDNRPVLAYYDSIGQTLKIYLCNNTACSIGTARVLDGLGAPAVYVSLAIRTDGRPVIAYHNNASAILRLYICEDPECSSGMAKTLDDVGSVGGSTALVLRSDDRPVIAYYDQTNTDLNILTCSDTLCNTRVIARVISSGLWGQGTSLIVRGDGNPLVLHATPSPVGGRSYFFSSCNDPSCNTTTTAIPVSGVASQRLSSGLALRAGGNPVGVYYATTGANLGLIDCADSACANSSLLLLDSAGDVGETPSIKVRSDGRPLISYYDVTNGALKIYNCANSGCSAGDAFVIDDSGDVGLSTSLSLRTDDRAVVSYWDVSNGAVKLYIAEPNFPENVFRDGFENVMQ